MARYRHIDRTPRFLALDLTAQLRPGTFEHAVHHLVMHELDLTAFDARFQNDATGATAYPRGRARVVSEAVGLDAHCNAASGRTSLFAV